MPPFIPNEADAFNAHQAEVDSVDFEILMRGYLRNGVLSGCAVSEDPVTPDLSVHVTAGVIQVDGDRITVGVQTDQAIATADVTNPRFDLISANSSGTVVVTTGTAAADPVFPAIPAGNTPLATVYVPASDTIVTDNQITDKRVLVAQTGYGAWFIAASNASDYEKGIANRVVDGTDDHVQIQADWDTYRAIACSSGTFDIGSPLEVGSPYFLSGVGLLTVFKANGITTGDRAVFVSKGNTAVGFTLADFAIDGNYAACHGIRMRNTGWDAIDPPALGNDNWGTFRNIFIEGTRDATTTYKGIWLESASSNNRSNYLLNISMREVGGAGLHLDGSSDNVITNIHVGSCRGSGFLIQGANNRFTNVKSFYADQYAFNVTSARNTFVGVEAQDMIGPGFYTTGANTVVTGLHVGAENVRACTDGVYVGAAGCVVTDFLVRIGSGSMDHAVNFASTARCTITGSVENVAGSFDTAMFAGTPDISAVVAVARNGEPAYRSGTEKISEVSGATTLGPAESVVNVDTSGGAVVVTLPDNAAYNGKGYLVRRDGASAVTVNRAGTDTFDDAATTKSLDADSSAIGIFSIGDGEWKIVATEGTVT